MKKLVSALIVVAFMSLLSAATIIQVPRQYHTIQAGINASHKGDTVLVADGYYTGTGNMDIDFYGRAIVVISENGPESCIIDCEFRGRGFIFQKAETKSSVVSGFSIINGSAERYPYYGGGIACDNGASPMIKNCIIRGNSAKRGGGIGLDNHSSPEIINCLVERNSSLDDGGGISCDSYCDASIKNCTIVENVAIAGQGGGVYINNSQVYGENNIIWGNGDANGASGSSFYCQPEGAFTSYYSDVQGGITGKGNIDADPLFYTGTFGDRFLSQIASGQKVNSHCVDAGNPDSHLITGTTRTDMAKDDDVVDMGYHYSLDLSPPEIKVILSPYNTPVQVPGDGGTFKFNLELVNNETKELTFDVWTIVTSPNDSKYRTIINLNDFTVPAGRSVDRDLIQLVPASALAGGYTYIAYAGIYPDNIWAEDHFGFEKLVGVNGEDDDVVDMGYHYSPDFHLPEIKLILSPYNTPVQVPGDGGNFKFNLELVNNEKKALTFDVWTIVTSPNGSKYKLIINLKDFTAPPGHSVDRDLIQLVPASALAGGYTYIAYAGIYPHEVWAEDHFGFEKLVGVNGEDDDVVDKGYHYSPDFHLPEIKLILSPYNTPVQVPGDGGTFKFNLQLVNNETKELTFDVWTIVTSLNGSEYKTILNLKDYTAPAGHSVDRNLTQSVPASAPAGGYSYIAYAGIYPHDVWAEDHFDFEKLVDSNGEIISDWSNWGEDFGDITNSSGTSPIDYTVLSVYPNPFNPATTISYELQAASYMELNVYDIQGREVAKLVDGYKSAGTHSITFNAQDLVSGVYFVRLEAGEFSQAQKVILMK